MTEFKHVPVMLSECIEGLNLKDGGIYFDGTLGGGGHSYEILKGSSPTGHLFATDLDTYAINRASEKLSEFNGRFTLINDNFKNLKWSVEDIERLRNYARYRDLYRSNFAKPFSNVFLATVHTFLRQP